MGVGQRVLGSSNSVGFPVGEFRVCGSKFWEWGFVDLSSGISSWGFRVWSLGFWGRGSKAR